MTLVHNERTKLTATWLNSIAAAAVAVGGIGPTIAAATGAMGFGLAVVLVPAWIGIGVDLYGFRLNGSVPLHSAPSLRAQRRNPSAPRLPTARCPGSLRCARDEGGTERRSIGAAH